MVLDINSKSFSTIMPTNCSKSTTASNQISICLGNLPPEVVDLGGPQQLSVDLNMVAIVESYMGKCDFEQTPNAMSYAGRNHIVFWSVLLQHEPHRPT